MGQARNWTAEELDYLQENWGVRSKGSMAQYLNRSVNAINLKAQRLSLGAFLDSGDYVTLNQLFLALNQTTVHKYISTSWIENRQLPVHTKKFITIPFEWCI
jgi:hypothetical protein